MPQHPNDAIDRLHAEPERPDLGKGDEDLRNIEDVGDGDTEDVDPDSAESDVDRDDTVTE